MQKYYPVTIEMNESDNGKNYTLAAPYPGARKELINGAADTTISVTVTFASGVTVGGVADGALTLASQESVALRAVSATKWEAVPGIDSEKWVASS